MKATIIMITNSNESFCQWSILEFIIWRLLVRFSWLQYRFWREKCHIGSTKFASLSPSLPLSLTYLPPPSMPSFPSPWPTEGQPVLLAVKTHSAQSEDLLWPISWSSAHPEGGQSMGHLHCHAEEGIKIIMPWWKVSINFVSKQLFPWNFLP